MRKTGQLLFTLAVAIAIAVAGCSDTSGQKSGNPSPHEKGTAGNAEGHRPTTVTQNEGMNKKQEAKLKRRISDLKKKVEDRSAQQPGQAVEDAVRAAAEDYYVAAEPGNYAYTYHALSSDAQSRFTEGRWVAANTALGSDEVSHSVAVDLTIIRPGGSGSGRATRFVFENGDWKHDLAPEEGALIAGATATGTTTASASASATAPSSPTASPNPSPNPSPNRNDDTRRVKPARNGHRSGGGSKPAASGGGGDINCDDVNGPVRVPPGDPNNLDADGDGWGCE